MNIATKAATRHSSPRTRANQAGDECLAHPSGRSVSHAPETVRAPVRSDRFKVWWTETQDVLPDDFEIGA